MTRRLFADPLDVVVVIRHATLEVGAGTAKTEMAARIDAPEPQQRTTRPFTPPADLHM